MKFSLVLATVGRSREFGAFIESLQAQAYSPLQLIVVDQNSDDRLHGYLPASTPSMEVIYLRCEPGLSRARNMGLAYADGDIVAFPDDDCVYGAGILATVRKKLAADPTLSGVTGRSEDEHGRTSGGIFASCGGRVSLLDVWIKATSYTIFLRRAVCDAVGPFDESLGLGAGTPFGAGEDTDYVIRAIQLGARLEYFPELTVRHPDKTKPIDLGVYMRAESYGAGMGRVLTKHAYPYHFRARALVRPLIGALVAACQLRIPLSCMRLYTVKGRLHGLLARTP